MATFGNILWFVLGGFLISAGYIIGGIFLMLTIIGIPFGIQAINFGIAALFPFGKAVTQKDGSGGCLTAAFNIIWLVLFGWEIALVHLLSALLLSLTIIGLPFARQHMKLAVVALMPFSYQLEDPTIKTD